MERVESGPRGTGKKQTRERGRAAEEEVEVLEIFFHRIYEFLYSLSTLPVITLVTPVISVVLSPVICLLLLLLRLFLPPLLVLYCICRPY